jgi:hypothetical protein
MPKILSFSASATPLSGGVAPTRAVGSFRSFRPRQETWFQAGTQDWATTTLNALESSCDPQGSTVTRPSESKRNFGGLCMFFEEKATRSSHRGRGNRSIPRLSFCGGHHGDFQEETNAELSCGSALVRATVTDKTSNTR